MLKYRAECEGRGHLLEPPVISSLGLWGASWRALKKVVTRVSRLNAGKSCGKDRTWSDLVTDLTIVMLRTMNGSIMHGVRKASGAPLALRIPSHQ